MSKIIEYDLETPWDLSTAKFSTDGSKMFIYYPDDEEKEIEIREKYPEVKRLYEEYRVALILAAGEKL